MSAPQVGGQIRRCSQMRMPILANIARFCRCQPFQLRAKMQDKKYIGSPPIQRHAELFFAFHLLPPGFACADAGIAYDGTRLLLAHTGRASESQHYYDYRRYTLFIGISGRRARFHHVGRAISLRSFCFKGYLRVIDAGARVGSRFFRFSRYVAFARILLPAPSSSPSRLQLLQFLITKRQSSQKSTGDATFRRRSIFVRRPFRSRVYIQHYRHCYDFFIDAYSSAYLREVQARSLPHRLCHRRLRWMLQMQACRHFEATIDVMPPFDASDFHEMSADAHHRISFAACLFTLI